ncbi:FUSC family protein [Jiella sonneratiae]|uniref:FUSC family protein n=1 Tax=Jiella sonneratiae TaxID=2816856 RepID=A0ABS3IY77_9HYPH|nr:FUSC family protein [Jiella sonneratiae]MBO0902352.1 FUSC family protein [Jiella sonneratiae]
MSADAGRPAARSPAEGRPGGAGGTPTAGQRFVDVLRGTIRISGQPMPWKAVAATMIAAALPPVVCGFLFGKLAIAALIAAMSAHLASKDVRSGSAGLIVFATGLAGFVCLGNRDMTLLVAPMVGIAAATAGHYGFARPVVRGLIFWTIFTSSLMPADRPEALFLVYCLSMIWSLVVTRLAGLAATLPPEEATSSHYSAVFGAVFATGLVISVYVGQRHFGAHGFWFPLTFVALCLPPHGQLFSRTWQRGVGTVLGTLALLAVAAITTDPWWIAPIGLVTLPLGFRILPMSYTGFIACLTVTVLAFLNIATPFETLAFERLATMGAAAAMMVPLAALGALALWLVRPQALKALQE